MGRRETPAVSAAQREFLYARSRAMTEHFDTFTAARGLDRDNYDDWPARDREIFEAQSAVLCLEWRRKAAELSE
ncbi:MULTISPECIES: hypothetical protein [unclassified Nocardia]|uniref:hypothetical protein n=1 Tax=unclassified Nocardia TaxID=2637762 RepID=UPI00278BFFFF|nr:MULTISPECIES: hypothetical protein [unclassified Nocardia]